MPIVDTQERGRCYLAQRELKPGEVILQEDALQAVLYDEQASFRCHHTFQEASRLLRCGGCQWARYQSRDAQKAAWADGHKRECAALRTCAPRRPTASLRLAARVFWSQQRHGQGTDTLPQSIETLLHHWDRLSDERKQQLAEMAVVTRQYMAGGGTALLPEPQTIAQLLARFACNNHTICDEELRSIGIGIFPQGAMLNHSCTPNVMQSFSGRRIIFRAITPIPMGAEATIAYVELAATREERRAELLSSYHFDIDAGKVAPEQAPLASTRNDDGGLLRIFAQPPTAVSAADVEMTAVWSSRELAAEHPMGGSGVAAKILPLASRPESYDLTDDDEDGHYRQTVRDYMTCVAAEEVVAVDCWGPLFWTGTGTEMDNARTAASRVGVAAGAHRKASGALAKGLPAKIAIKAATTALQVLDMPMQDMPRLGHTKDLQLGKGHIWRMRLLEVQLRAFIAEGSQWRAALAAAKHLLPFYRSVYPKVWPNLGLHLATLAKIADVLEELEEAAAATREAMEILRYTHPDSQIFQDMLQLQHNCLVDLEQQRQ